MTDAATWTVIALLGAGTYLTRFSFLGLIGDRPLPDWVLRHLRYTPVAVLPGLVAPILAAGPDGSGPDAARLIGAAVALGVGIWRRNAIPAIIAGGLAFALLDWLL